MTGTREELVAYRLERAHETLDDARLLGACTFDYYQSARGGEGPGVPSAVVPRHKYLTAEWRWFNTITMPASPPDSGWSLEAISEAVLENPPPLS